MLCQLKPNAYIYKPLLAAIRGPITIKSWAEHMNRNGRTCEKLKNFVGKVKKIFWGLLSAWALIQGNLEVDHSV